MYSFSLSHQNDTMQKYKRQIYLLAFPIGILITCLFAILVVEEKMQFYIAICMIIKLVALTLLLLFVPRSMRFVDLAFYFSYTSYFLITAQVNLYSAGMDGSLDVQHLGENVNSLAMWTIVFLVGAYLSLHPADVRILIVYIFIALTVMAAYNLWFLYSNEKLHFDFIFRWVSSIGSLAMATLLIQRMGVLQQRHASTDELTGLMNRHALYRILMQEQERSERYKKPFSIILFDLDHFKAVNDTHGHLTGDAVLKKMSKLVSGAIRQIDHVGRWGGEEFLIILPETGIESAVILASRVHALIQKSDFDGVENITASFGVTTHQTGQSLEEMLYFADTALYQAKENGRNQVVQKLA